MFEFNKVRINPIVDNFRRIKGNTLSILINKSGEVTVKAPYNLRVSDINAFINKKMDWINKKKIVFETNKLVPKNYSEGEKFLYLGDWYELKIVPDAKNGIEFDRENFILRNDVLPNAKDAFSKLYKILAYNYITFKTIELSNKYGFQFGKIKFNYTKTKWGSCTAKKTLIFNSKLIMAPVDVVDYVIIHELCHTKHMNHSKEFWSLVAEICPDYKNKIKWLKLNGHTLEF